MVFGWLLGRRGHQPSGDLVSLAAMRPGQRGVVADVHGGHRMVERLAALGIRPGKRITKVSSMLLGGPVTIEVDRAQVAIGHHTAARILIDVSVR